MVTLPVPFAAMTPIRKCDQPPQNSRKWDAIIRFMGQVPRAAIKTGSNADFAFAVVVLASYFATFSAVRQISLFEILLMLFLGLGYIWFGIYGYAHCGQSDLLALRLGYFLVQIPLGGMIVTLGKGAGFNALLLLPLAGHAVVLLSDRWMYVVNAGILAIYVLATSSYAASWSVVWESLPPFLAGLVFIVVFTQSSVNEERARKEVERLVAELQDANQRLRTYAVQAEELAITKERNRLAREIHDGLGHYLTTIHMQIQAARAVMERDPKRSQVMLDKAQSMTHQALADVRQSVSALRDSPEATSPLPELVEKLLSACEAAGIETEIKLLGTPRQFSPQANLTLYRAAQECINNTCKHSQAKCLWVSLDYLDGHDFKMMFLDDGVGTESLEGGFGLLGIRERVQLLEGSMSIETARNQGFRLEIRIPV